jgi:hypothetical protein
MIRLLEDIEKEIILNMTFKGKVKQSINEQLSLQNVRVREIDKTLLRFGDDRPYVHHPAAEFSAEDADKMLVNIMLFLDTHDHLYELEFLKWNGNDVVSLKACLSNYLSNPEKHCMIRSLEDTEKELIENIPIKSEILKRSINEQLSRNTKVRVSSSKNLLSFSKNKSHTKHLVGEFFTNDADGENVNVRLLLDDNNKLCELELVRVDKNLLLSADVCLKNYLSISEKEKIKRLSQQT